MKKTTITAASIIALMSAAADANDFGLNCVYELGKCQEQIGRGPCTPGLGSAPCRITYEMVQNHKGETLPACRVYNNYGARVTTWFCGSWEEDGVHGCPGGPEDLDEEYGICRSDVEVGQTVCVMRERAGVTTSVAGKNITASRRIIAAGVKGEVQTAMETDDGACLFFPEPEDPVEKARSQYALYTITLGKEFTEDSSIVGVRIADKKKQPWMIDSRAYQIANAPDGVNRHLVDGVEPYEITRSTQNDEGDGNTHSTWFMYEFDSSAADRIEINACHGCVMGPGVTDL